MPSTLKTTLRIDPDLMRLTKRVALEEDKTIGQVIEESLELYLKQKGVVSKPSSKNIYQWAETLAHKNNFAHLKEADIVRLIKESRPH